MRNYLSNEMENTLRLMASERVLQLEGLTDNINVVDKQLSIKKTINEVIMRANSAPNGLVEVLFLGRKLKKEASISRVLLHSKVTVSGFNVQNAEEASSLFRTLIVVDPTWDVDKLEVYGAEYGLPIKFMKRL